MQDRIELPPLDDERVARLEERIVVARRREQGAGRRRLLSVVGAAAALLVVSAMVGAAVSGGGRDAGSAGGDGLISTAEGGALPDTGFEELPSEPLDPAADLGGERVDVDGTAVASGREIQTSATATVRVASTQDAVDAITRAAAALGGYVETSSAAADGLDTSDPSSADSFVTGASAITIRVPAAALADAMASLDEVGMVLSTTSDRRDVTTEAIDLRARIDAARASVDRLTALIGQAASTADLIAAESALAERQAELESMQQQLTALEGRVALSSLAVTLLPETTVAGAEPAGFLDGLLAGWNGLVGAVNGIVVGLGFLLPWLVVGGVVTVVVVAVRRRRRRTG